MFKAIVLACVIGSPTDCVEFHSIIYSDTREACRRRAFQMSEDIGEIVNLMPSKWRCKKLKEGNLADGPNYYLSGSGWGYDRL
jgi:hypothetical protein